MKIRTFTWAIGMATICLFSCHSGSQGVAMTDHVMIGGMANGGEVEKTLEVVRFSGIESRLAVDIHYTQGAEYNVKVRASQDVMDRASIFVSGSTLILKMKKDAEETLEVVLPEILEGQDVLWSVTPKGIVDVTPDAGNPNFVTVKAVSIGSAKITATIGTSSAVCNVTVNAPKEDIDGSTIIMNLSLYENSEEVAAKIKEVDGKGVREYKLYGDFSKLGKLDIKPTDQNNPFIGTNVEVIDFTGIDADTWPLVEEEVDGGTVSRPGMPDRAFNRGTESKPIEVLESLRKVILPEACKALGYYSFQRTNIEVLIAPGVELLGQSFVAYSSSIEEMYLTTSNEFQCHKSAFASSSYSKNCILYLNPNKAPIEGNKYFKNNNNLDIEWKSVDTSGALPSE